MFLDPKMGPPKWSSSFCSDSKPACSNREQQRNQCWLRGAAWGPLCVHLVCGCWIQPGAQIEGKSWCSPSWEISFHSDILKGKPVLLFEAHPSCEYIYFFTWLFVLIFKPGQWWPNSQLVTVPRCLLPSFPQLFPPRRDVELFYLHFSWCLQHFHCDSWSTPQGHAGYPQESLTGYKCEQYSALAGRSLQSLYGTYALSFAT